MTASKSHSRDSFKGGEGVYRDYLVGQRHLYCLHIGPKTLEPNKIKVFFSSMGKTTICIVGQMTLQSSQVFISSRSDWQRWKVDIRTDALILAPVLVGCCDAPWSSRRWRLSRKSFSHCWVWLFRSTKNMLKSKCRNIVTSLQVSFSCFLFPGTFTTLNMTN